FRIRCTDHGLSTPAASLRDNLHIVFLGSRRRLDELSAELPEFLRPVRGKNSPETTVDPVARCEVPRSVSADLHLIPGGRVAGPLVLDVVLVGPEERNGIELSRPAQCGARGGRAVLAGRVPVLDVAVRAATLAPPPRAVACPRAAGRGRPTRGVGANRRTVQLDPARPEPGGVRAHPYPDDDTVAAQLGTVREDNPVALATVRDDALRLHTAPHLDPFGPVQIRDEAAYVDAERIAKWNIAGLDEGHGTTEGGGGGRDLPA